MATQERAEDVAGRGGGSHTSVGDLGLDLLEPRGDLRIGLEASGKLLSYPSDLKILERLA